MTRGQLSAAARLGAGHAVAATVSFLVPGSTCPHSQALRFSLSHKAFGGRTVSAEVGDGVDKSFAPWVMSWMGWG